MSWTQKFQKMNYSLVRQPSTENGVFGTWFNDDGTELCVTVERPWADNETGVSCVLPAPNDAPIAYCCQSYESPKHGKVWMLQKVKDRLDVEIHAANTINDLEGCIGVGDSFGNVNGMPAVLNSQDTLEGLRDTLPDMFLLTISWGGNETES